MKLTAHVLDGHTLDVRPAPRERPWMDRTAERYAYRCLPLDIANAHGWELLCQTAFEAEWNGGNALDDLRVQPAPGTHAPAVSHFGYGVLTFHVPCLFRTEAGVDLYVTAPVNRPKDGIAGLTGLIETDWSPYTFTMNWQFTRPGRVRFEAGEPFCHFFPVQRRVLAETEPRWQPLSQTPELEREHQAWMRSRGQFLHDLEQPGSDASREGWQRSYFRGPAPGQCPAGVEHRVKLRLAPFTRSDDAE
ncbi:DUF6065 family protein [Xanthomonas sacchari]|uniref:DUF6065 family protein n=1 Tax=Xanthomonas sacchari TaxID=56458 RepID=UPI003B2122C7